MRGKPLLALPVLSLLFSLLPASRPAAADEGAGTVQAGAESRIPRQRQWAAPWPQQGGWIPVQPYGYGQLRPAAAAEDLDAVRDELRRLEQALAAMRAGAVERAERMDEIARRLDGLVSATEVQAARLERLVQGLGGPPGQGDSPPAEVGGAELVSAAGLVMELLSRGDPSQALASLGSRFPVTDGKRAFMARRLAEFRAAAVERNGRALDHVLIKDESVGGALRRLQFAERHEAGVTRWAMTFYRPKDDWLLTELAWDARHEPLF